VKYNAQSVSRIVRIFILVLAIVATLGVSVASASHFDSSPNGCNLCFVAHTVAFETPSAHPLYGPEIAGLAILAAPVFSYQACDARPSCSRGPPSSL
jgi:hypothetical protein